MSLDEARAVLDAHEGDWFWIQNDRRTCGDALAELDGSFTARELEAMGVFIQNGREYHRP